MRNLILIYTVTEIDAQREISEEVLSLSGEMKMYFWVAYM